MKINFCLLVLTLLSVCSQRTAYAQKALKEGTITYSVTADMPGHPEVSDMFSGSTTTVSFKPGHLAQVMNAAMNKTQTIIDATNNTGMLLMDAMGNKMMVKMNQDQMKRRQEDVGGYDVKNTDETKQIAGYTCKKAIINMKDGNTFDYWYTDDIVVPSSDWKMFSKVSGFPLQYQFSRQGIIMTFTATKVNTDPVNDQVFVVDTTGYKEVSFDDLMKMMGKK